MAGVVELYESRTTLLDVDKPTCRRRFHVRDLDNEEDVINALHADPLCPASLSWTLDSQAYTLARLATDIKEIINNQPRSVHLWEASVSWGVKSKSSSVVWTEPPETRWSMSFSTESAFVKVAYNQTRFGSGGPPAGNYINVVNREGRNQPEGTNVLVPTGILRGCKTYTASDWNSLLNRAKDKIGKVNASSFNAGGVTFQPGELLMTSVDIRETSDGRIEGEVQMLYSPNASGDIDGISWTKGGWEYLWVYSTPDLSDDQNWLIDKTQSVYSARVYDAVSFDGIL